MTRRMEKQEQGHQLEEMLASEQLAFQITSVKDLSCFTCKTEAA